MVLIYQLEKSKSRSPLLRNKKKLYPRLKIGKLILSLAKKGSNKVRLKFNKKSQKYGKRDKKTREKVKFYKWFDKLHIFM